MATLRKFEFSVSTTFVLEVGEFYMRVIKDDAYILDGTDPLLIVTPYLDADTNWLKFKQINDVIYVTHPDYPVHKLSRIADDDWDFDEIEFDVPPMLDENIDDTLTITPSGTTGSITLTASAALFNDPNHVDSYWRIGYLRDAESVEQAISSNTTSSTLEIIGPWVVRTYGVWTADVLIQRQRVTGGSWETIKKVIGANDRNVDLDGEADENYSYRLKIENYTSNTDGRAILERSDAIIYGTVKITAVASATSATATVVSTLIDTSATYIWAEGAWSAHRGYPRACTLHEGRLWFGGTVHQAQRLWGSQSDDFENFETGTADGDAVVFDIASTEYNAIQWLVSQSDLVVGLAGSEARIRGDRNGQIITPSRVDAKIQSKFGSEYIDPVVIGGQIIFPERRGRTLREMVYSYEVERYVSDNNLNLLNETITEAGIVQMAFQRVPVPTIWCVLTDGTCAALTYDREQNVMGWHWHDTPEAGGQFKSVVALYGDPDTEDEVYFLVRRVIDSIEVHYIEKLDSTRWTEKDDAYFVDSGITYDGTPVTVVTGLSHLVGETVDALADGVVYRGLVVDSGGSIELPSGAAASSKIHVGLPFTSTLEPFRFDADSVLGVHSGKKKRIDSVTLRLYKSLGMSVTIEGNDVQVTLPEGSDGGNPDDAPLFGNDRPADFPVSGFTQGNTYDPVLTIKQTDPLPLSIMSINVGYQVSSS